MRNTLFLFTDAQDAQFFCGHTLAEALLPYPELQNCEPQTTQKPYGGNLSTGPMPEDKQTNRWTTETGALDGEATPVTSTRAPPKRLRPVDRGTPLTGAVVRIFGDEWLVGTARLGRSSEQKYGKIQWGNRGGGAIAGARRNSNPQFACNNEFCQPYSPFCRASRICGEWVGLVWFERGCLQ